MRSVQLAVACALCAACQFETGPILGPGTDALSGTVLAPPVEQTPPPAAAGAPAPLPPSAPGNPAGPAPASAGAGGAGVPPSPAPSAAVDAGTTADAAAHDSGSVDAGAVDAPDAAADAGDAGSVDPDEPQVPEPGSPFSACTTNTDCRDGLVCTTSLGGGLSPMPTTGAATGYCTAWCTQSSGGAPCPQPSSGDVEASCQFGSICALGSCERMKCPAGLTCTETQLTIGLTRFDCLPAP